MTLQELAAQYRESAQPLRVRVAELREALRAPGLSETERLLLKRRLRVLEDMLRETLAMSNHMAHYYDRGYRRCARYTL